MKKVLLGLFALSSVAMANNVYMKMGLELSPKVTVVKDEDGIAMNKKSNSGVKTEFAFESTSNIRDNFELGLGIAKQYHKKTKGSGEADSINLEMKMNSAPIYAIAKYNLPLKREYRPYLFVNLGYSMNHGSCKVGRDLEFEYKNGMYYAAGIGLDNDLFVVELAYKVNQGKLRVSQPRREESHKFDYGRITLGVGLKFPSI